MNRVSYWKYCDFCRQCSYDDGSESEDELEVESLAAGWRKLRVENGSYWDACPACVEKQTAD